MVVLYWLEQGECSVEEGLQKIIRDASMEEPSPIGGNEQLQGLKPFHGESIILSLD